MDHKPQIDLNVTNNCNFRCVHCGFDSGNVKMGEMSLEFAAKVLTEFKELGGEKVDFTGGEPLMNADLSEMIKLSASLGLKTKIVTNGSLCTKEKLEQLKAVGLNGISVSIDGSDYSKFNKTRPVSETLYTKVVQCVKDSVELGLYTKINTVVFKINFDDLENIIKQAIDFRCNEIRFCFFAPLGRGRIATDLTADLGKWLQFTKQDLTQYSNKIKIVFALPIVKTSEISCLARKTEFLQIFPNGDAYPCSIMASLYKPIINLNKCSLKEFWTKREVLAEKYYQENIGPLFEKKGGCINIKLDEGFEFVCPSRKFCL